MLLTSPWKVRCIFRNNVRFCQIDTSNQFYSLNELHSLVKKIKLNKNNDRILNGGNLVEAYREYHTNFGNKGITDKEVLEQLVVVLSEEDKELCKLAWKGFFENNEVPSEVSIISYLRAFKDDLSADEVCCSLLITFQIYFNSV